MYTHYKDFLKAVGDFGKGVFTLTMIKDRKQREALRQYIYSNKHFFCSGFSGKDGKASIYILTKEAYKAFDCKGNLTEASTFAGIIDIALLNAYMIEQEDFFEHPFGPHLSYNVAGNQVGLISHIWKVCKQIADLDYLICTKPLRDEYLSNTKELQKIARKLNVTEDFLIEKIENCIIPAAFEDYF